MRRRAAGSTAPATSPLIEGCWFVSNSATSGAGAFFASSTALVRNCVFRGNSASFGSGASFLVIRRVTEELHVLQERGAGGTPLGTLYCFNVPAPSLSRCVIAFSTAGPAMTCNGGAAPSTSRSIVFGNAGGNTLCGTVDDNLALDPLFCGMDAQNVSVCANSPCLAANNAWGEAVGALGVGCSSCGSAVQPASWGGIKSLYR